MKKTIFMLLAGATLTGCVDMQNEVLDSTSKKEISFQVAKFRTSRASEEEQINGTKFEYDHFVTHAWSDAVVADDKVFMNHQKVVQTADKSAWMPTSDYYWPNYSTVDFISYYPENADKNCPVVERDKLTYTGYDVADKADITVPTNDLMYAEKAVGYSGNINRVNDDNGGTDDSGYSGVPTLFHHALAQLEIRVLVKQPAGESESRWEAVIDHAKLDGYYTKGDLELTLEDPALTHGVTGWTPAGEAGIGWKLSNDATANESVIVSEDNADNDNITISSMGEGDGYVAGEKGCKSLFKAFVLPQILTERHFFDLKFTLKTYRDGSLVMEEADADIRHIQLKTDVIPYWGMNQKIVYTIIIDPGEKIMLDPAVVDWEDVTENKDADDYLKFYIQIPGDDDWKESNVWHAYNLNGQQVAEVSKELIRDPQKNYYQAVIVNPVVNGKTDLKNGFIAQVLKSSVGSPDNLAGGSVSYLSGSEINYTNRGGIRDNTKLGNDANYSYCKIENGKIIGVTDANITGLTKYENKAYTVTDNDIDKNVYPVVRCGATYWLRENLRAKHYRDGTEIADAGVTTIGESDKESEKAAETRIFYDKAAYKAPSTGSEKDIKTYGLLYNFRAVSGADESGYWCHNPNNDPYSALAQKGTPRTNDSETNPTICPEGWYIPHVQIQYWDNYYIDIEYIDSYLTSLQWQYLMSENQPLLTSSYPTTNNWSGFSLNLCPGYGQDSNTFGLASGDDYNSMKNSYCIPFWTANLWIYEGMLYPAPAFLQADSTDIWYQFTTDNYGIYDYLEMIGKAYYPVRCVRIDQ